MVNIRKINKNGLCFDCPDYYDIGRYPDSDEVYQNIVALSKNDRECEIYVMEFRWHTFDNNARKNPFLLKQYLKMQGYNDIVENGNLPYSFNAIISTEFGMIKTTILFNFNYENVITVVGNVLIISDYDCTNDIKIINNSFYHCPNQYEEEGWGLEHATAEPQETKQESGSLMDELERLGNMYEKGLLTDDEFAAMKKKLIEE